MILGNLTTHIIVNCGFDQQLNTGFMQPGEHTKLDQYLYNSF